MPHTLLASGPIYQETCNCPSSLEDWLEAMQCPASYRQIKQDLSIFRSVDMEKVSRQAVDRFNQRGSHSLCHYVIKDNKVCQHLSTCVSDWGTRSQDHELIGETHH